MIESISELSRIWSKVLSVVKDQIQDPKIFDAFLGNSYLYSYSNGQMIVGVDSSLAAMVLNNQYIDIVQSAARTVTGGRVKIDFQFEKNLKEIKESKPELEFFKNSKVNQTLTFDNFIVGQCNIEAKQAALFIAANPGKAFNPLFIYSNSGLGKTHLLHAIVNYLHEKESAKRALYCTSDEFMSEFVKFATGETSQNELKNYFASFDVVLIDDIQFLGGKQHTERFLFDILNSAILTGKQFVLTSDKHPSELKGFEERLKGRFAQGLTVSIQNPDIKTCVEILKSKIKAGPLDINSIEPDVLEFIAQKFSNNIRNLDNPLNQLVWFTTIYKPCKVITMSVAMEALQALIDVKDTKTKLTEQKVINVVADYYSLTPSQLTGRARPGNVVVPRQIAMYLIRELLDVPFTQIGIIFGGKDHSTVMHAVTKVENELKTDTQLQTAVSDIKKLLK